MALRVSKPQTSPTRPGSATAELPARAQALVAQGDLAGYRALFAAASEEPDAHRRYAVRKDLLQAGLNAPRGSMTQVAQAFVAVATEGLALLDADPREPQILNAVGIALYELGALAGAKALFEAAHRLDPQMPHVERNLREVARRRRQGVAPKIPAAVLATLRPLEADAKRVALRARPAEGLTLTLCMIVRDEEAMLPRCLAAVADAVDEIVVVDTGSTDATMDIAREFGAKVVETEWTGDFAAARNVSFDAATSDWIVYLDADEVLAEGQAERLRDLTGRTWREAFFLVEHNHTGALEDGTSVHHNALRVFRNRPEYRFEGRIHEQIAHNLPAYLPERLEQTEIRVEHYGYLGVVREEKDKSRRNLELLEAQLAEGIDTPFLHFNLGSEHAALGQTEAALPHFEQAWAEMRDVTDLRRYGYVPSLVSRLASVLRALGHRDRLERHVEEALVVFPGFTDLVLDLALAAMQAEDLGAAATLLERCLEMGDAPSAYSATVGSGTFIAQGLLGEVHHRAGRLEEAERVLRDAFAANPRFLGAVEPLAQVLLEREVPGDEVAATIHGLVAEDTPSMRFLLAVPLYEAGAAEAAERELRAVLDRQPHVAPARIALAEALLSQKRYADAAEEAARVPSESPSAPAACQAELFARLAAGETSLDEAFGRARAAGLDADALALFGAWQALLAGGDVPAVLGAASGELLLVVMEALLRVADVDPFVAVLPLAERLPLAARDRRERLAQMYFRRGFVDSAADEWAAACEIDGPDAAALAGLAAVAVVRDQPADAELFASTALELEPGHPGARRVLERLGRV
jgi:glycosyltransferase involved in cell wall biosynthesis/Tfp pilus assembly protein PilF